MSQRAQVAWILARAVSRSHSLSLRLVSYDTFTPLARARLIAASQVARADSLIAWPIADTCSTRAPTT
jgi:hypothetical protein